MCPVSFTWRDSDNSTKCKGDFNPENSPKMGRNYMYIIYYMRYAVLSHSVVSLSNPMDYSLLGSSVHADSPCKNIGVGCHAFLHGIFLTQGWNPGLPHCRQILYHLTFYLLTICLVCLWYLMSQNCHIFLSFFLTKIMFSHFHKLNVVFTLLRR